MTVEPCKLAILAVWLAHSLVMQPAEVSRMPPSLQLSILVDAPGDSLGAAPFPLVAAPVNGGTRLTGVWASNDIKAAYAQVADVLEVVGDDVEVVDLLTGRRETAAAAKQRMRDVANVRDVFTWRSFQWEGLTFWRLFGGYVFGKPDLIVEFESDVAESSVAEALSHLARYLWMSPRELVAGEPIPYGHWLLSAASSTLYGDEFWDAARDGLGTAHLKDAFGPQMVAPAPLFIIEARTMVMGGNFEWVVGASRAARTLGEQARTHARLAGVFGIDAGIAMAPPFAQDPAVVGSDLEGSKSVFGQRRKGVAEDDSGWHFGSADGGDGPPATDRQLGVSTVSHLVDRLPGLVRYLALPEGWVVTHDAEGFWVSPPWSDVGAWLDVDTPQNPPWDPTPA